MTILFKRILIISSVIYILLFGGLCVCAEEIPTPDETRQTLSEYVDFYGDIFENGINDLEDKNMFSDAIDDFNIKSIMNKLNSGELSVSPSGILNTIIRLLLGEVYSAAGLMATVLAVSVLGSYLQGLKDGFGSNSVANCAFYVCYIVAAGVTAAAFYQAAECTTAAVKNTAVFMRIIVPVMIGALAASGAAISAATLEPAMLGMIEMAVWITETVFVPAVMISAALNIVNGMSDKFKTDRMIKLLNNAVKWGMSIVLTVFVSLVGLKSIASSGADGLAIKLSKFAASNLIPVVGGILSESVETVMNCSALIKNTVGIVGIICLALIALRPILKIAAILILFRISAALAEPVSDPKIITCISRLGDSISVLFSILAAVTVMFIIVVTIMINAGNSAVFFGR